MALTTPFHPRLSELNTTGLYGHWAGYLSATQYDLSVKDEYFGVRNAAAVFDASPLFKYWIRGRDAQRFLEGVMARDVRKCKPGRAQYTVWCNDDGYVLEDGVLFRHSSDEFMLTSADPNLSFLRSQTGRLDVEIVDASDEYGTLAIQGPRSRAILAALAPEVGAMPFFSLISAKVAGHPVFISRTGFSGDLGYEVMVPAESALPVLDAILEAGVPHRLRPYGEQALGMARIEAALPLIGVDFTSARFALNDDQRFTPDELGLGWLLGGIDDPTRPFTGRRALLRERGEGTSRWSTVGISVATTDYRALHESQGLIPEMDHIPVDGSTMLYANPQWDRAGYATSFMYSPMMQRHIGLARVQPQFAPLGTVLHLEQTINHEYFTVPATVVALPFYNPERKVSTP